MHVHELNPKRTVITLVIFAIVIVIGLLTVVKPRLKYEQTIEQTVDMVVWDEGAIYPYELIEILDGTNDTVVLIDLRNTFEFGRGHIPGAENISAVSLLDEKNISRLKNLQENNISVLLYANSQVEANGAWMVLRQLGFNNVNILLGGYNYYVVWKNMLGDSYGDDEYLLGSADYDYKKVATIASDDPNKNNNAKSTVTFSRKKKSAVAEGGC